MRTLGRLVSHHPWAVLIAWLIAAALSVPFAARAPAALNADPASGLTTSESTLVTDALRDRFGETDTNTVILVTRSAPALGTPAENHASLLGIMARRREAQRRAAASAPVPDAVLQPA